MEHPHHRWLRRLGDDLQDEYENIQADLGGHPEKIQESGHRAETAWIALLLERWLPPELRDSDQEIPSLRTGS